ncbi:MAG: response regulator [Ignavibacteriales bacterium]|nr:MAG: response regulator [Ignavibacteriales bacterium]
MNLKSISYKVLICIKILVFILLFIRIEFAQQSRYSFEHITSANGLSANTVLSIMQDSRGLLWVGTHEGLNRFDGYNFKVFTNDLTDSLSLSANAIYAIQEDTKGDLWIGTYTGGLNKFNRQTESFIRIPVDVNSSEATSSDNIYALACDKKGNIWVGTSNGLNKYDVNRKTFDKYFFDSSTTNSISSNIISSLAYDEKRNVVWIGTKTGGLNKLDLASNEFIRYTLASPFNKNQSVEHICCLFLSEDDVLWIGSLGDGLFRLDILKNEITNFVNQPDNPGSLSDNSILSLHQDQAKRLWVGTYTSGLNLFEPATKTFYKFVHNSRDPGSIGDNTVYALFHDNKNVLWIGTWTDGLNKLIPDCKFRHYRHDPENKNSLSADGIYAIIEDRNGNVWLGTDVSGLNRYDTRNNSWTHFRYDPLDNNSISSDGIYSLLEDREGKIWIGTDGAGVCRYNSKTGKFIRYQHDPRNPNSLSIDAVSVMFEDIDGDIWIGSFGGGLNKFSSKKGTFSKIIYNPNDPLGRTEAGIYSMFEDSDGIIWIGTYGSGLFAYNKATGQSVSYHYTKDDTASLSDKNISSIMQDSQGTIWVGTYNGLNKFSKQSRKFIRYTTNEGLPNNTIYGLLEDNHNNLWISTNKGLCRFNYRSGRIRNYNTNDGILNEEFNQWAYFKGNSGKMYFGGVNGLTVFNPDEISDDTNTINVVLTKFNLFNKPVQIGYDKILDRTILKNSIAELDNINLTHEDYVFSLEFSALEYSSPGNIRYAYKLEGFDEEWTVVESDRRVATYTNLSHGTYIFNVKSTNRDGIWNDKPTSVSIIISPPWWKTNWAYSGYALVIFAILFSVRTYDLKRQRLKHQLKLEHEHAEKLEEVDNIKSRFFANISHEFRTPLTLIVGPAEQILNSQSKDELKKNVGLIKQNANNLLSLINQLLELSKLDSGKLQLQASEQNFIPFLKGMVMSFESLAVINSLTLKLDVPSDELLIFFDKSKMETILKNLLSNAFKFTPNGKEISICLTTNEHNMTLSIRDTGVGMDANELPKVFDRFYQVNNLSNKNPGGTGIGLSLVKELVELHHGQIQVTSRKNEWTEFKLTFPLGKNHLSESEIDSEFHVYTESKSNIDKHEFIHLTGDEKSSAPTTKNILLIVEDNYDVREFIKDALGDSFHYEEAENGELGILKACDIIPDLIISDVMMPIMDGNAMTQKLKADQRTSHIPVILLTARSGSEDRIAGLETGADDYLTKPFDAHELMARIINLISIRKKLQEIFNADNLAAIPVSRKKLKGIDAEFMQRVLKVIEEHISEEEFTIEDFGNEVGMSRSQMFRKIKALTGKSCSVYLRSIRLSKAKVMLKNNENNVSEIAYSVGFNSPSYFSHCFKEEFGYAPSEMTK